MDKETLKKCIDIEVDHWGKQGKLKLTNKIWSRYFRPESNAVYLIRKKQYWCSTKGRYAKLQVKFLEVLLMRRYGIMIGDTCEIGLGFKIWHPYGVIINNVIIGENFQVQHNCTIGLKDRGEDNKGIGFKELLPVIGNDVCMYAGSYILGPVKVGNNVTIGANTVVLHDLEENGTYVGSPARKVK